MCPDRPLATPTAARFPLCSAVAALLLFSAVYPLRAQPADAPDPDQRPTLSGSAGAAGVGVYQDGRWGVLQAQVKNPTNTDQTVRVYVQFDKQPNHQFARVLRIPANAMRQVQLAAYVSGVDAADKSTGNETILLAADAETELQRQDGLVRVVDDPNLFLVVSDNSVADDQGARALEHVRESAGLPKSMTYAAAERVMRFDVGWDGVKVAAIMADDAPFDGAQSRGMRRWLDAGGTLVVFADQVEPDAMRRVLGADWPVALVDRITLTTLPFVDGAGGEVSTVQTEDPITMARVLAPGTKTVLSVHGWPALLEYPVGRGRVVVITVGGRAFAGDSDKSLVPDDEAERDGPAPARPETPSDKALRVLTDRLLPSGTMMVGGANARVEPIDSDAATLFVSNQIGRKIMTRGTVAAVLLGFVGVLAVVGLLLGRKASGEWLGVVGVIGAGAATAALLGVGRAQSGDIEPTAATLRIAHTAPGRTDVATQELIGLYDNAGAQVTLTGQRGGWAWPVDTGTAGSLQRMVWHDLDSWEWPTLNVPANAPTPIRTHWAMPLQRPVTLNARYTADGLTATLDAPDALKLEDPMLATSTANLGVDLGGGAFTANADNVLPPGVYFTAGVLGQDQQDRGQMLDALVDTARFTEPTLLAWSAGPEDGITIAPDLRRKTQTLWQIPLTIADAEPGERVRVPWPMIRMIPQRVGDEKYGLTVLPIFNPQTQDWIGSVSGASAFIADFQLPPQVLPLNITGATVHLNIRAIGRPVRVLAIKGGRVHEIATLQSPDGPQTVPVDPTLLEIGAGGRVKLAFDVGAPPGQQQISMSTIWSVEHFGLEVAGTVASDTPVPPAEPADAEPDPAPADNDTQN